jgi:F420-0:gamma-glutamyl ligase
LHTFCTAGATDQHSQSLVLTDVNVVAEVQAAVTLLLGQQISAA